jgi:hypothetical protein
MRAPRTQNFDISGSSFFRVFRINLLNKVMPLGNLGGGIGLKPGLVILFLHWFGRPLFRLLIRYEPQMHRLHQRLSGKRAHE